MQLHHTKQQPDWEMTSPGKRNRWQLLAMKTRGIITPPNAATLLGLALCLCGFGALLTSKLSIGLALLAIGRLLDLVDGWLAEHTGTKSPLGELLDASVDKLVTGLTIIVLGIANIAPWLLLGILIAPHLIISLIVLYRRQKAAYVQPTKTGKLSMAGLWVGLLGLIALALGSLHWPHPAAVLVYVIALISSLSGCIAAVQYARQPSVR